MVCLWTITSIVYGWNEFRPMAKSSDAIRVATYIQGREQSHQPIVIFASRHALTLEYYYRGVNSLIPLPHPLSTERFDFRDIVAPDGPAIGETLSRLAPGAQELWLVFEPSHGKLDDKYHSANVREYFSERYDTVSSRQFYNGLTVQLLHAKTPSVQLRGAVAPSKSVLCEVREL